MSLSHPDFSHELHLSRNGAQWIVGVDEVGRGPLAGPVTAAAVRLNPEDLPQGLQDSKRLSAKLREALFGQIMLCAEVGIGHASPAEIDEINILQATYLAMTRAIAVLPRAPDHLLIDGNRLPRDLPCPAQAVVKGDGKVMSIAAASIIAKVTRDRIMADLGRRYPGYGWAENAGYPTKRHINAIADLGVTPEHRRSFAPIRKILCPDVT
ncbi:MAG: ribonuclease HII [Natronohydrobacter sp.]|nr:ribonuclease HII [Natronohydrobacter sp.]